MVREALQKTRLIDRWIRNGVSDIRTLGRLLTLKARLVIEHIISKRKDDA